MRRYSPRHSPAERRTEKILFLIHARVLPVERVHTRRDHFRRISRVRIRRTYEDSTYKIYRYMHTLNLYTYYARIRVRTTVFPGVQGDSALLENFDSTPYDVYV